MVEHENNAEEDVWSWRNKQLDASLHSDENFNVTIFLLICLSCLVLYICIRWYRYKPKQKRRKSYFKQLISMLQCRRSTAV